MAKFQAIGVYSCIFPLVASTFQGNMFFWPKDLFQMLHIHVHTVRSHVLSGFYFCKNSLVCAFEPAEEKMSVTFSV
jgi:hypothetical protein